MMQIGYRKEFQSWRFVIWNSSQGNIINSVDKNRSILLLYFPTGTVPQFL